MVVVGLITCERVVLGKGAKVLISESAQGICPPHRGRRSLMARRKDRTIGEKIDSKREEKWRSRRESNTQHERMEMTHEMM